jgi:phosphoribosylformimino-5-aminoimidazole carboxamide ribotide isomerase
VQGERLAIEHDDVDEWIDRFRRFRRVQVIDLDAAMNAGANETMIRRICAELPCRVGGGIRSPGAARRVLDLGAHAVIVGSALFSKGAIDVKSARGFAAAVGENAFIAAVDSRRGRVVIDGWKTELEVTTVDAVATLDAFCGEFLYTHVDTEGLMRGIDMHAVMAVRGATARRIAAAGGITTREEIDALERHGVDAVVGMAIYTGLLNLDEPFEETARPTDRAEGG